MRAQPKMFFKGENVRAECTFAQSKEQGLGQAAEVDLLDRLLARKGT
jgi:hypothetical protein